jgi:hypothetical protein
VSAPGRATVPDVSQTHPDGSRRREPRGICDTPGLGKGGLRGYGSEGWGFESLRARPGHRPYPLRGGLSCAGGSHVGSHGGRFRAEQCLARGCGDGSPVPSTRCPYTSLVMVMLACPKISDTTCNSVPWASISEAPECRSSCGCQWPSPARLHSLAKAREKFSDRAVPSLAGEDQPPVDGGWACCSAVCGARFTFCPWRSGRRTW